MAGKKVWVTWMPTTPKMPAMQGTSSDSEALQQAQVLKMLDSYGLKVGGAQWVDDLKKMAWYELASILLERDKVDLWLIAGERNDLESVSNRYALSLITATVREGRGNDFPIFCLGLDYMPDAATMPSLIRDFRFLLNSDSGWPAKIVTSFVKKTRVEPMDFRLTAIGHQFIGQWFEVGPREGEWQGVMFGVSGEAKITHHIVGQKGMLPEKGILEYPAMGIGAEVKGVEYTACSVQNTIGNNDSYFVKVEGFPGKILFGGHPGTDKAEVRVLDLI